MGKPIRMLWSLVTACVLAGPRPAGAADSEALIQIGVEVVEVQEQKAKDLGIDWLTSLQITEESVPSLLEVGTLTRDKLTADLRFLMANGAADLLANPKLVTRNRTTATFHSGGEIPYATSGSLGTVNVEFKPFGIDLKINPHLDDAGNIAMTLDAEVSGVDPQNSVVLAGNSVPGIRSRSVTSQLTLKPGSTLTLAGLIQTEKQIVRRGVPGLMSIPGLGLLFSRRTESNKRTSIVVFVTPTVLDEGQSRVAHLPELP